MKKILYLHAGAEMYGADKVLLDLIKGLDKSKFEPHVILPNDGVLVDELKKIGVIVKIIDYPILRRKYFNINGVIRYICSYKKYSDLIVDYVRKNQINLIHNNTTAVLEGIYVKQKCHIPLIWHVHEILLKPKIVVDFINFLMGKYADEIVTVSDAVATHILKSKFISEKKVRVIYNGVDSNKFNEVDNTIHLREKFHISMDKIIVGMIGRVNAWKGQNDFLTAMEPILKENKNVVAFLAGGAFEGEEWRILELDNRIASLDCSEQIIRIDYYKNTNELYNLFDIFVLPSTNPDPLPTVVLEAMACGKAIVGYKHGGICEMVSVGENGLLADVRNTMDLSEKINILIENSELRAKMGKNSRNRLLEKFSISSYISNYSNEYLHILEKY